MSFKKNLFTIIMAVVLVLIGSWLVGISKAALIDGMTLVLATMVMTLLLEDFWRKALNAKELLTWEYFMGFAIISASVLAWLWASESKTVTDIWVRLSATFLSAGLGGFWMAVPYRKSIQEEDERAETRIDKIQDREQKRWEKWQKKIDKATKENAYNYLASNLRVRLFDNSYLGDLDFSRALIESNGVNYTLEEAEKEKDFDLNLIAQAKEYILDLIKEKE